MAGNNYQATLLTADGLKITEAAEISFNSATAQPANNQNAVTSGALSQLSAWVSGTAQQNTVGYPINVALAISDDGTNNAATVAVALSPDGTTYTTLGTVTIPAGLNNLGATTVLNTVTVPTGWYIKLTIGAHATVAQSYYY